VTCNERPPILGFEALNPPFTIQKPESSNDDRLPEAATCFNTLRLPRYSKVKILKEKLLYAIMHNKGFYNL
jgi:ubiquitin-protein ligase E3 C